MLQYGENINILGYLCSVLCGCVGPSWLMAMLWTRHASGTQLGPSYLQGGQQTFLPYFSKKHLGTQKNKIYYSQTLEGIWLVQVRSSGEGREVREGGFGILPLLASKSEVSGIHGVTHYWLIESITAEMRARDCGERSFKQSVI